MTKKQNAEELFEIIGSDAHSWLAQARRMKMVADTILPLLQDELLIPPAVRGTQERGLAYLHSYMLLTGLAFENLIKGILIGRNPALVTGDRIESGILGRKGHGIAKGAKSIIRLTPQELQLLGRIEEYLFWSGRYPLPLKSGVFVNSEVKELRTFRSNDPESVNKLFDQLATVLEREAKARG